MDREGLGYLCAMLLFIVIAVFPLTQAMEVIAYTSAAILLIYASRRRYGDNS